MIDPSAKRHELVLMLAAGAILLITMGARQTSGLFLLPITQSTGVSIVAFSFALAIGQFVFGAAQPIFGAIADKYGAARVIVAGAIMLALGSALTPFMSSSIGLLFTMGLLAAAGAAAGSFSILIGIASQRLAPQRRSFAAGFINAGGSIGQFVFAPVVQFVIGAAGWASAMFATAFAALLTIPLVLPLRRWCGRGCPCCRREAPELERAAARRDARSQLSVSARRVLHLRFSHCVSRDTPAE